MGLPERYRAVDQAECLRLVGGVTTDEFRANYESSIQTALAQDLPREPQMD